MNSIQDCGKYFLYRHIRNDTNLPFYIGIGTKKENKKTFTQIYDRAFVKANRSPYWKAVVSKSDYTVEILVESDSLDFIKNKEKEFIALYKRTENGGSLCNLTDGGDGAWGHKVAEEHKQILRTLKAFSKEVALFKMKEVHGDMYDYSKFEYANCNIKSTIICKEHGEFLQNFSSHVYKKAGCRTCANIDRKSTPRHKNAKLNNILKYVRDLQSYDKYSLVTEISNIDSCQSPVQFNCKDHGPFVNALHKVNKPKFCQGCYFEKITQPILTTEECIRSFRERHQDKYDYSRVIYTGWRDKLTIICPDHGEFYKTALAHYKSGCPKCSHKVRQKNSSEAKVRNLKAKFSNRAYLIHQDKYDFSEFSYVNAHTKSSVICFEHGCFDSTPSSILSGAGCPECKVEKLKQRASKKITATFSDNCVLNFNSLKECAEYLNMRSPNLIRDMKKSRFIQSKNCFIDYA